MDLSPTSVIRHAIGTIGRISGLATGGSSGVADTVSAEDAAPPRVRSRNSFQSFQSFQSFPSDHTPVSGCQIRSNHSNRSNHHQWEVAMRTRKPDPPVRPKCAFCGDHHHPWEPHRDPNLGKDNKSGPPPRPRRPTPTPSGRLVERVE